MVVFDAVQVILALQAGVVAELRQQGNSLDGAGSRTADSFRALRWPGVVATGGPSRAASKDASGKRTGIQM